MGTAGGPRPDRRQAGAAADATLAGADAAAGPRRDRRRAVSQARSAQASRAILHTLCWVLVVFYATDYLPPLAVRWLGPGDGAPLRVYLVGYCALAVVCGALGTAFALRYRRAIAASRYPQRWLIFPTVLAVLLIPAQGWNEWLTRAVEVGACLAGLGTGLRSRNRWRWRSRRQG